MTDGKDGAVKLSGHAVELETRGCLGPYARTAPSQQPANHKKAIDYKWHTTCDLRPEYMLRTSDVYKSFPLHLWSARTKKVIHMGKSCITNHLHSVLLHPEKSLPSATDPETTRKTL